MPPREPIAADGMHLDGQHRRDDKPASRWPIIAVVLVSAVALVIGFFVVRGAGDVEDQRDSAAKQAQDLGEQVVSACARGDIVQSPDGRDLCQKAAEVQSDPVPGVALIEGPQGRPPTPEEIQTAVDAYLAAHPPPAGQPPSAAQVAAAVAEYMLANPPAPGRPPTAAEIAAAVETYFANNPVPAGPEGPEGQRGPRGQTGETGSPGAIGEPGRPPTDEEIRDAVDAWLAENPPSTCPAGSQLQPVTFASGERGLGCVTEQAPPDDDEDPPVTTTEDPPPPTTTTMPPTTEPDEPLTGG